MKLVARQRDEELRSEYREVLMYETSMLVFIDETGTDHRDTLHKYERKGATIYQISCKRRANICNRYYDYSWSHRFPSGSWN